MQILQDCRGTTGGRGLEVKFAGSTRLREAPPAKPEAGPNTVNIMWGGGGEGVFYYGRKGVLLGFWKLAPVRFSLWALRVRVRLQHM